MVSAVLAFAIPSRGADPSAAVQKAFEAVCGLHLRYIEALFDATRTMFRITGYRDRLPPNSRYSAFRRRARPGL
jgi:hypothetical protein